jgi:hypothetical protein
MRLNEIEARNIKQVKTAIDFAVEKYRRNKVAIYKGSDNYGTEQGVFYRDPTAHAQPRISANTQNYVTLWVDNSPKWSHFPKRGRSLICSTDPDTASGYGEVAVIIPLQDTNIGICPAADFWDSFSETMPAAYSVADLNAFINDNIRKQLKQVIDQKTLTYPDLVNTLDELGSSDSARPGFDRWVEQHSWRGMMDVILDPGANEFRLTTWKHFNVTGDHEVWLSAPCAMLGYHQFERLVAGKVDIEQLLASDID